jgi:hypothetical protein
MKAAEARTQAKINAPIIAKRKLDFEAQEAARKKAIEHAKRKAWRVKFEEHVRHDIENAVKVGETECLSAIYSTFEYPWHTYSDFKQYETFFEYKEDVKLVQRKLKKDGYTTELERNSYEVDDRAAYLNSGGECGSEETYWTADIVLKVSW